MRSSHYLLSLPHASRMESEKHLSVQLTTLTSSSTHSEGQADAAPSSMSDRKRRMTLLIHVSAASWNAIEALNSSLTPLVAPPQATAPHSERQSSAPEEQSQEDRLQAAFDASMEGDLDAALRTAARGPSGQNPMLEEVGGAGADTARALSNIGNVSLGQGSMQSTGGSLAADWALAMSRGKGCEAVGTSLYSSEMDLALPIAKRLASVLDLPQVLLSVSPCAVQAGGLDSSAATSAHEAGTAHIAFQRGLLGLARQELAELES